ncbi:MAG: hypothetical protein RL220_1182 [Bacteroidota bacterium]
MKLTRGYDGLKIEAKSLAAVHDILTVEQPLSVQINGEPFTVTMQTPGHEKELIRGLLFTEGVYKDRSSDLVWKEYLKSDDGTIYSVNLDIPVDRLDQSLLNKRSLLSVASCGICGKTELNLPEGTLSADNLKLNVDSIASMFGVMSRHQGAFISSGGCHAASAFDESYSLLSVCEDIGRHNAVDKVIGDLLIQGSLPRAKYLLVSGRVSYEILVKSFVAGIPVLMAVSAPSSLAVDFATELGITLMGFCREGRATVYTHPERILTA